MRTERQTGSSGSFSGHLTLRGGRLKKLCPTQHLILRAENQHLNISLELVQEASGKAGGASRRRRKEIEGVRGRNRHSSQAEEEKTKKKKRK